MEPKVLLLLCVVLLGTVLASGEEDKTSSTVTISVINEAGVVETDLKKAEQFATRVYQKAGVDVRWVNHSAATKSEDGCKELSEQLICLVVTIVPKPSESMDGVLGVALSVSNGMGKYAYVFYGPVRELESQRLSSAGVLGFVIAHEAGHILLGANSHSGLGIMQPCWASPQLRKASMGNLLFTSDQAELMRKRIRVTVRRKVEMAMRSLGFLVD